MSSFHRLMARLVISPEAFHGHMRVKFVFSRGMLLFVQWFAGNFLLTSYVESTGFFYQQKHVCFSRQIIFYRGNLQQFPTCTEYSARKIY